MGVRLFWFGEFAVAAEEGLCEFAVGAEPGGNDAVTVGREWFVWAELFTGWIREVLADGAAVPAAAFGAQETEESGEDARDRGDNGGDEDWVGHGVLVGLFG